MDFIAGCWGASNRISELGVSIKFATLVLASKLYSGFAPRGARGLDELSGRAASTLADTSGSAIDSGIYRALTNCFKREVPAGRWPVWPGVVIYGAYCVYSPESPMTAQRIIRSLHQIFSPAVWSPMRNARLAAQQWTHCLVASDWYGEGNDLCAVEVRDWWRECARKVLWWMSDRDFEYWFGQNFKGGRVLRYSDGLLVHVTECVKFCKFENPRCVPGIDDDMLRNYMRKVIERYVQGKTPTVDGIPVPRPELNNRLDLLLRLACNAYHVKTEYDAFDRVYAGQAY